MSDLERSTQMPTNWVGILLAGGDITIHNIQALFCVTIYHSWEFSVQIPGWAIQQEIATSVVHRETVTDS